MRENEGQMNSGVSHQNRDIRWWEKRVSEKVVEFSLGHIESKVPGECPGDNIS